MILAYRVFTTLLYPILFLFVFWRKMTKKEDQNRYKEKVLISHFKVNKKLDSKLIWFHAASIGEFKSIMPIVNHLNINNNNLQFLITTSTLSSGKLATSELKKFNNMEHRYLPYDINFLISKFMYLWRPNKIFLVDSEIWPNLLLNAKKYKIPIALINARLTSKSFKNWMIFPNVAKKIFNIFNVCICSNTQTKNFLKKLNLKNIYFKGNIKLIEKIDYQGIKNINENILSKKIFWFAASTHKEEDNFCLKTHIKLKEKYKDIITIIAPRHIDRAKDIKILSENLNLKSQILNKDEAILENKEIIIINYFGALKNYFKYAKSVFIGKSIDDKFKDNGGQNPIEAAKLDCKIYHGPYVSNFEETYSAFQNLKIATKIDNFEDLSNHLLFDLQSTHEKDPKISVLLKNLEQKTFADTMEIVENFINNDVYKT